MGDYGWDGDYGWGGGYKKRRHDYYDDGYGRRKYDKYDKCDRCHCGCDFCCCRSRKCFHCGCDHGWDY